MTLRTGIVLAISLFSSCLFAAAAQASAQPSDGFPLQQGTFWIYECGTSRKEFHSPPVQQSLSWKMEILESLRQHDLVIALLRGHPDDLPGAREPQAGYYLIVAVRNTEFYLVAPPRSQELFQRLKQTQPPWAPLVQGQGRLFLELPLIPGRGFPTEEAADAKSGPHRPGFDSWLVLKRMRLRVQGLKSNVPLDSAEQYSLSYGLNKSEKKVDFVPGVGITEYDYHGYSGVPPAHTEWKGLCKLIQFHRGDP